MILVQGSFTDNSVTPIIAMVTEHGYLELTEYFKCPKPVGILLVLDPDDAEAGLLLNIRKLIPEVYQDLVKHTFAKEIVPDRLQKLCRSYFPDDEDTSEAEIEPPELIHTGSSVPVFRTSRKKAHIVKVRHSVRPRGTIAPKLYEYTKRTVAQRIGIELLEKGLIHFTHTTSPEGVILTDGEIIVSER